MISKAMESVELQEWKSDISFELTSLEVNDTIEFIVSPAKTLKSLITTCMIL